MSTGREVDEPTADAGVSDGWPTARWAESALRTDTGVPLYVQIRNLLREQIRLGEWNRDEPMPTEDQLVTVFGVSRTTVRQAMTDLEREGLVTRKAGRGTFARQPVMVLRMQQMHSFSADLERRGLRSSRLTLVVGRVKAGTEIANLPEELAGQDLVHFQQVRYADDLAVVVFDHYFPFEICSFFLETPLDSAGFTVEGMLGAHDIVLTRAKGEVRAAVASDVEARYLEVPKKSPLVEIAIISFDERERAIEYARAAVRTDRYPLALYSDWSGELLG